MDEMDAFTQQRISEILNAQFTIFHFIKNHPQIPVFFENSMQYSTPPDIEGFRKIFPNGVPAELAKLSFNQVKYLVYMNGHDTAYNAGLIKANGGDFAGNEKITRDSLVYDSDSMMIDPGISQTREYNTLHHISLMATQLSANKVILIYGAGHPFDDVIQCFPQLELKKIPFPRAQIYDQNTFNLIRLERLKISDFPRPLLNCNQLQKKFLEYSSINPARSSSSIGTNQIESSSKMTETIAAASATLIIPCLLFGIFRQCFRKPKPAKVVFKERIKKTLAGKKI
jgi:hypothetical protein